MWITEEVGGQVNTKYHLFFRARSYVRFKFHFKIHIDFN